MIHFENNCIHLGIKDGPKIEIPFPSLPSNALIVSNKKGRKSDHKDTTNIKKLKLSTNLLRDKFHRSDGAMARIKAHDLWQDVHITIIWGMYRWYRVIIIKGLKQPQKSK